MIFLLSLSLSFDLAVQTQSIGCMTAFNPPTD